VLVLLAGSLSIIVLGPVGADSNFPSQFLLQKFQNVLFQPTAFLLRCFTFQLI